MEIQNNQQKLTKFPPSLIATWNGQRNIRYFSENSLINQHQLILTENELKFLDLLFIDRSQIQIT